MEEKIAKALEKVIDEDISYDDNLFDEGILNSLRVIDLVIELEDLLGIEIDAKYVTENNFSTKAAISLLMEKLLTNERSPQVNDASDK